MTFSNCRKSPPHFGWAQGLRPWWGGDGGGGGGCGDANGLLLPDYFAQCTGQKVVVSKVADADNLGSRIGEACRLRLGLWRAIVMCMRREMKTVGQSAAFAFECACSLVQTGGRLMQWMQCRGDVDVVLRGAVWYAGGRGRMAAAGE